MCGHMAEREDFLVQKEWVQNDRRAKVEPADCHLIALAGKNKKKHN